MRAFMEPVCCSSVGFALFNEFPIGWVGTKSVPGARVGQIPEVFWAQRVAGGTLGDPCRGGASAAARRDRCWSQTPHQHSAKGHSGCPGCSTSRQGFGPFLRVKSVTVWRFCQLLFFSCSFLHAAQWLKERGCPAAPRVLLLLPPCAASPGWQESSSRHRQLHFIVSLWLGRQCRM